MANLEVSMGGCCKPSFSLWHKREKYNLQNHFQPPIWIFFLKDKFSTIWSNSKQICCFTRTTSYIVYSSCDWANMMLGFVILGRIRICNMYLSRHFYLPLKNGWIWISYCIMQLLFNVIEKVNIIIFFIFSVNFLLPFC